MFKQLHVKGLKQNKTVLSEQNAVLMNHILFPNKDLANIFY